MPTRYVSPIGSNTAPYETAAKGAQSLTQLIETDAITLAIGDITYLDGDNGAITEAPSGSLSLSGSVMKDPASTNRPVVNWTANQAKPYQDNALLKDIDFYFSSNMSTVPCILPNGGDNIVIDSCLVDGASLPQTGTQGIGVNMNQDGFIVKNCIIQNIPATGLKMTGSYSPVGWEAVNNTLYNCAKDSGIAFTMNTLTSPKCLNNIISGGGFAGGRDISVTTPVADNNTVHNVAGTAFISLAQQPNEITGDPLFVTPGSDYHLQSGSPARNTGAVTTAVLDFEGTARPKESIFDMGALEFFIPDVTPPTWENSTPSLSSVVSDGADVDVQIDEDGNAYLVVVPDGAAAPSSAEVKAGESAGGGVPDYSGNTALTASTPGVINITGLTPASYDVYVVAEDAIPNLQVAPVKVDLDLDVTPPTWENSTPSLSTVVTDGADVDVEINEDGTAYMVVVPDGDPAPSPAEVKAGESSGGGVPVDSNNVALTASTPDVMNITGLSPVDYDVYLVAEDTIPNLQAAVVKLDLNLTPPEFASTYPKTNNVSVDTADIDVQINQDGNAYVVTVLDGDPAPSSAQIRSGEDSTGTPVAAGFSGSAVLTADTEGTISLSNLTPATLYDVYVVGDNDYSNPTSDSPVKVDLDLDTTVPVYADGYPKLDNPQATSIDVLVQTNEDGNTYAVIVADDSLAPSKAQVKAGEDGNGDPAIDADNDTLTADAETTLSLGNITQSDNYDVYVIAEDPSGNSAAPVRLDLNNEIVIINRNPVDMLTGLNIVDRASRKIDPELVKLAAKWAELVDGRLQAVTTGVPGTVHKFPLSDATASDYESNDVKVGRIATMETVGTRVTVNILGYVPGITKGEKLIVSVEAGEEGKLRSPIGATAGTYEIVARCENIDNDSESMTWTLSSPEFVTV